VFDSTFRDYTGKDWISVLLWWVIVSALLWVFSRLDDGLGYGVIGVLAIIFAMTRHELSRLRRDVDDLKMKLGGGTVA